MDAYIYGIKRAVESTSKYLTKQSSDIHTHIINTIAETCIYTFLSWCWKIVLHIREPDQVQYSLASIASSGNQAIKIIDCLSLTRSEN